MWCRQPVRVLVREPGSGGHYRKQQQNVSPSSHQHAQRRIAPRAQTLRPQQEAILPGQRLKLNVFEPRYVALVRNSLRGSRRFAMLGAEPAVGTWGTEVEVLVSREHHFGTRLAVEVVGLAGRPAA